MIKYTNTFFNSVRLAPLCAVLGEAVMKQGVMFSKTVCVHLCVYTGRLGMNDMTANFLLGQAKLAILKSHKAKHEGQDVDI